MSQNVSYPFPPLNPTHTHTHIYAHTHTSPQQPTNPPKDDDTQIHPAGRHVPQTSGDPSLGLPAWIASNPTASLCNTDIVLWHTFGLTHFPAPEDFPVMPAEPMSLLLRPRHFFTRNPCLDVAPSYCSVPSGVGGSSTRGVGLVDRVSMLAFGEKETSAAQGRAEGEAACCGGGKFGAGV